MEALGILIPSVFIVFSSIIMWIACRIFIKSSRTIGYRLPDGTRGATINAIGSSLPEFIAALFFFFLLSDSISGISAALGTVVGSAIFNILIIPAVVISILIQKGGNVIIRKKIILRECSFCLITQIALYAFFNDYEISNIESLILLIIYIVYLIVLFRGSKLKEIDINITKSKLIKAWKNLLFACLVVSFGCLICVKACEALSYESWNLSLIGAPNISFPGLNASIAVIALFIVAGASSIPDLFMSAMDAKSGDSENALSNPLGSNIFDLCIAFSVPLALYTFINGNIVFNPESEGLAELKHFILLMIIITLLFCAFTLPPFIKRFNWWHVGSFIFLFLVFIFCIFSPGIFENITSTLDLILST